MQPKTRSERTARLRDAQRGWLASVIERQGTTATQIARAGRLNPSTLTRFLKDDERGTVLSTATIAAIAEATGETPPGDIVAFDAPRAVAPPREAEAEIYKGRDPATDDAVRAMIGGDVNVSPWTMRAETLALAGVRPGDVMIVDQAVTPRDGDVVCAQVEQELGAQTIFRLYRRPWLVTAGLDPMGPRPDFVDGERVRVVGVMTGLVRARAA